MAKAIAAPSVPCIRPDAVARLDEAAFGEFYRQTSRPLWSYVCRVTSNPSDSDDIVQEAFLRLLRSPPAGEDAWRPYLYRVAGNLVIDRWRSSVRQREGDTQMATDGDGVAGSLQASGGAKGHGEDEDVARLFGQLTPRERALLWLAYVEGESHEEIAASLGLGRRSIKVLLFRAKRRLRDLLKSKGLARV
jgi:RNA polymerase sigma-70 factor (ECF subfamily)